MLFTIFLKINYVFSDLVVQLMKLKADPINTEEEEAEVTTQMNELLDKVKAVALNTKKSAAVSEDH